MRAASTSYLPQEPKEPTTAYQSRLERAVLFPGLKRALKNFVGKAFANSVTFKDTTPEWLEWFKNIDLAGTSVQAFSEMVFHSALKYGHSHILAEYPVIQPGATLFDERQVIKARPYLVHRTAKEVIGWRHQIVNNSSKLTRARILECYTDYADQWDDEGEAVQVRVLSPGLWEIWRKNEKEDWFLYQTGMTSLTDTVPLVTVNFDKGEEPMTSHVPMGDLAWANVAHWQSYSDQRNILRIARVPMIFVKGATTEDLGGEMTIGPQRFIALSNPNADMKFIEHSGAAINAGRQDCLDLEERMMQMAAEAMMSRPGSETATGRAIDSRDATSPLAVWVQTFEAAMNEAFELMAEYAGADKAPVMQMTRDFGIIGNTSDLDTLNKARATREISRAAYLDELKRRGVLSEMFDAEDDAALIDEEPPADPVVGGFGGKPPTKPSSGEPSGAANE